MKSPAIPEIEPQFEKEIDIFQHPLQQPFQVYVIRWETPTMQARLRSSIFEETLTPDPSPCRWLLDIISEDKHMVKISIHFVLSENQLILVVDYTFDVHKSQVQLKIDGMQDEKLNISDQNDAYNKQEDDTLLSLKTDKEEPIDANSKVDVVVLLDDKADKTDIYTKIETDTLLEIKQIKQTLIPKKKMIHSYY
ncbi:MAG: hypothetical protein EZS28_028854 [Streblomastix strix]|uniref:Uncharacterized protein n=1 Tax=Streblomastix strix TaxID=222440 RepID=A0A5J4UYN1_9EUKA|nr:MAG: hypothetical protein EZS28_028854 [Streblomastix strix]